MSRVFGRAEGHPCRGTASDRVPVRVREDGSVHPQPSAPGRSRSTVDGPVAVVIVCIAVMFALCSTAAPANPKGVAVIVGNRHYQDGIPEVPYAHRDAAAFKEYLTGVRGFDPDNIIELSDATQGQMTKTFGSASSHEGQLFYFLPDRLGGASEVVVFYSGHGVPGTDGQAYLATADADLGTAHLTAYPLRQLYANLGKLPAKSVTVFVDACFSGVSQGGALPTSASPVYRTPELPVGVADDMTVLTAASGNELASWDEQAEHGMFTHHLLNALYGAGDDDADGRVTAREVARYLGLHLTRAVGRAYMRPQTASLIGEAGAVLAFAPRGGFPPRPKLAATGPRAQPFTVMTEPATARVRILNIEERYRTGMELPAGDYRVEVSAGGYDSVVETVRHGAEGATEYAVALRRAARRWTAGERFRDCPDCPQMVVIPAGRFEMGCDAENCGDDEKPVHEVRIDRAFALSAYEVTRGQYRSFVEATGHDTGTTCAVLGDGVWAYRTGYGWLRPGYAQDDDHPAVCVSWDDAQSYVTWLSGMTGESYRLPSEAEWEYAARAGARTRYHWGDEVGANRANCDGCGSRWDDRGTAPVGSFAGNRFGHDLHGNVWEWVEDCWNGSYAGAPGNGSAWLSGECGERVLRGGSWNSKPGDLRAADRSWDSAGFRVSDGGFRVARTLAP